MYFSDLDTLTIFNDYGELYLHVWTEQDVYSEVIKVSTYTNIDVRIFASHSELFYESQKVKKMIVNKYPRFEYDSDSSKHYYILFSEDTNYLYSRDENSDKTILVDFDSGHMETLDHVGERNERIFKAAEIRPRVLEEGNLNIRISKE